ncbi:MAG: tRNA (adenosine(37)-N6)-dimethylallyltransferase MiaA [Candidatus Omnitrophica bacterium]|nr:tRNA (adenosine(37)-N6)-dimethylallyltransferase MiaA [Candidatus Omnitrophota bacterium]
MKKVLIVLGPTGAGKTSASIEIAKHLDTEIISSDSMQIYKHMDIGTAKPTVQQRGEVVHHMIDILEPWESFSAGEYIKAVKPIIKSLHKRRKIPVIVGGTGLYIKAMTRGIFKGPSADWDLREELLSKEHSQKGFLYSRLKELDPSAASRIMLEDTRRIIRALEVCLKTGSAITDQQKMLTHPLPYKFIKIGITRDREELYKIIDERVDEMMRQGLVDEVKNVIRLITESRIDAIGEKENSYLFLRQFSSMQAIGYKEIAMYLSGEISLENAINLVKQRSRNYAKRQFTWFKKEENIQWINLTGRNEESGTIQFARILNAL